MFMTPRQARLFYFFAGVVAAIFAPAYAAVRSHYGLHLTWPLWFYFALGPALGAYCLWMWWRLCEEDDDF